MTLHVDATAICTNQSPIQKQTAEANDYNFLDVPLAIRPIDEALTPPENINLDDAELLDICSHSDFRGFDDATEALFPQLDVSGQKNKIKKAIRFLLVEFARLEKEQHCRYLKIHLGNNFWSLKTYNPQGLGRRGIISVLNALEKKGFVYIYKGAKDLSNPASTGFLTRIRHTEELLNDYITRFELTNAVFARHRESPLIILKDRKKKLVNVPHDIPNVQAMAATVRTYNQFISNIPVTLKDPSCAGRVNYKRNEVYRVFNVNFEGGGRFYGPWWQSLSSQERENILIEDMPTFELDYEAQSVYMLYALSGMQYDRASMGDPYEIGPLERQLYKKVIAISLNCKSSKQAWEAAMKSFSSKEETSHLIQYIKTKDQFKEVVKSILSKHPVLKKYLYSGIGLTIMNKDSLVCETVIRLLTERKIPVLTVHDSFIVKNEHKELLRETMVKAYCLNDLENALPLIK